MIFVSAGHHNTDSGAIGNGYREADLTKKIRDKVIQYLVQKNAPYIADKDTETLSQYLNRIQTGSGSVVLEFHLDAGGATATGTTAIVSKTPSQDSKNFAKELADKTACILGIKNRGVITETQSARGSLAIMRESGIVCLLEVCFISNQNDLNQLLTKEKFDALCLAYAEILIKYDALK